MDALFYLKYKINYFIKSKLVIVKNYYKTIN